MNYFEFELPDEREITPDGQQLLLEVTVRKRGIWRIHPNDPDIVFPSDPHADRIDAPEKLDLYTGEVFDKNTKKHLYKLTRKDMRFIYNKIMNSKEELIKDKLLARKSEITYL
jgi:hypothetical protein